MTPARLALALLLGACPAAALDPRCAGWSGSTERMPLDLCNPLPREALDYAARCLAQFRGKVESRYVVIGNNHGVNAGMARLYVLEWNARDPAKSMVLLRGGLGIGSGNGTVDGTRNGAPAGFRDQWDSASSPGGCMRLFGSGGPNQMPSHAEIKAFKVEGLEQRNACVLTRGIHFHESGRVERRPAAATESEAAARFFNEVDLESNLATASSPGCFNVNEQDYARIRELGVVFGKGTLFLSWDGCREPLRARGAARRCQDASDVLQCADRMDPPVSIPQKMLEQKRENQRQMARFSDFLDRVRVPGD